MITRWVMFSTQYSFSRGEIADCGGIGSALWYLARYPCSSRSASPLAYTVATTPRLVALATCLRADNPRQERSGCTQDAGLNPMQPRADARGLVLDSLPVIV